jgi:predicted  nucleic acid-binding Zn-ribbon protein
MALHVCTECGTAYAPAPACPQCGADNWLSEEEAQERALSAELNEGDHESVSPGDPLGLKPDEDDDEDSGDEPVSVADQKAAGVPADERVTIAEQKAGTPPPDLSGDDAQPAAAEEPDAGPGNAEPAEGEAGSSEPSGTRRSGRGKGPGPGVRS